MTAPNCRQCPHCGDWVPFSDPCPVPSSSEVFIGPDGSEETEFFCAHSMVASDPEAFAKGFSFFFDAP